MGLLRSAMSAILLKLEAKEMMASHRLGKSAIPPKAEAKGMGLLRSAMSAILLKLEAKEMVSHKSVMSAIPLKVEAKETVLLRSVMSAIQPKAEAKETGLLKFPKEESLGTGWGRLRPIAIRTVEIV